jgi:hypothetical protein
MARQASNSSCVRRLDQRRVGDPRLGPVGHEEDRVEGAVPQPVLRGVVVARFQIDGERMSEDTRRLILLFP